MVDKLKGGDHICSRVLLNNTAALEAYMKKNPQSPPYNDLLHSQLSIVKIILLLDCGLG